ncbi:MAG: pyridoxamine 5'-phosphate oxidase family protein [Acidimicrobiia bacterium]
MNPTTEGNLDGYGAPQIEWGRVQDRLESHIPQAPDTEGPGRHTSWLATTNPGGTPHVMPLGALWIDDAFFFTSGPGTRKSRNLEDDPRCVITVATHDFDLVVEGEAVRVTDDAKLQHVADVFGAGDWHPTVQDSAFTAEFSAPSAGPSPWYVYEMTPKTIFALGASDPYGATRFGF